MGHNISAGRYLIVMNLQVSRYLFMFPLPSFVAFLKYSYSMMFLEWDLLVLGKLDAGGIT